MTGAFGLPNPSQTRDKKEECIEEAKASMACEWKMFKKEMEMSYRKTSGDKTRKIDDLYDKVDQLQIRSQLPSSEEF